MVSCRTSAQQGQGMEQIHGSDLTYHWVPRLFPEMNFLGINSIPSTTNIYILFTNVTVSGLHFEMNLKMQCTWLRKVVFGSWTGSMANGTNALKLHLRTK